MAMRLARTNDVWRHLFKPADRPLEQLTITYKDTFDGPDLVLVINAPISLLCGENGVGKSRSLRAVHQALGGNFSLADFRPKSGPVSPVVSSVHAVLHRVQEEKVGERFEVNSAFALSDALKDSSGESKVYWFDPTIQVPYLLHLLRHDRRLSDLWEGVDPKRLSASNLEEISGLVGRVYTDVEFFEIADYQGHEVIPYFRVTCCDESYGSEDMGLGELSLLFLYWMLGRLSFGAVLLMEEPETFIAPKSQRTLVDMIAAHAKEKSLFVVFTSHSGIIAQRVPNTHIDFLSRRGKTVTFFRDPPRHLLRDGLALVPPRSLIALVEDKAAALFAKALLESGNSKYVSHCGIFVAGGESEITKVLEIISPGDQGAVTIIGLFDGDMRGKLPKKTNWHTMCLPGNFCPEIIAKDFLETQYDNLDNILLRPKAKIIHALAAVGGTNHHDWLPGLCAALHMSIEELFRRVADGMLSVDAKSVDTFVSEFDNKATDAGIGVL